MLRRSEAAKGSAKVSGRPGYASEKYSKKILQARVFPNANPLLLLLKSQSCTRIPSPFARATPTSTHPNPHRKSQPMSFAGVRRGDEEARGGEAEGVEPVEAGICVDGRRGLTRKRGIANAPQAGQWTSTPRPVGIARHGNCALGCNIHLVGAQKTG